LKKFKGVFKNFFVKVKNKIDFIWKCVLDRDNLTFAEDAMR